MRDWVVSWYYHVHDTESKDHSLIDWLKMTQNPTKEFLKLVESYRKTLLRRDKEKIPCCTVSARIEGDRNLDNIGHMNDLICIDIDRFSKSKKKKSNPCINLDLVKELMSQHPSVLYCGFSVSGSDSGMYVIFVLEERDRLEDYFNHFKERFSHIGINIDETCKDYTRLRFFSVDKEAYFNENVVPYSIKPKEPIKSPAEATKTTSQRSNEDKVRKMIDIISTHGIDITSSYDDWVSVGAALADEFGESGREMFHEVSRNHPEYNEKSTDFKFNSCLKMHRIKINSFFKIANDYGVRY